MNDSAEINIFSISGNLATVEKNEDNTARGEGSLLDTDAYVQSGDVIESEFKLYSHNCVHFQTNTLGKSMTPHPAPALG